MSEWATVRTFAAQIAESALPSAASFVQLDQHARYVEFACDTLSTPSVPTTIVLTFWKLSEGGRRDRIGTQTITAATETDRPLVQFLEAHGQSFYVTVGFTGGSTPTLTGTVKARAVYR